MPELGHNLAMSLVAPVEWRASRPVRWVMLPVRVQTVSPSTIGPHIVSNPDHTRHLHAVLEDYPETTPSGVT